MDKFLILLTIPSSVTNSSTTTGEVMSLSVQFSSTAWSGNTE